MKFKRNPPKSLPRKTYTIGTHPTHPQTNAQWKHMGLSEKVPEYHLWKCTAQPEQPSAPRMVRAFESKLFSSESKAGRGGCSMRWCPGDAVAADEQKEGKKQLRAYCEIHVSKLTLSYVECSETMIWLCVSDCSMCRKEVA